MLEPATDQLVTSLCIRWIAAGTPSATWGGRHVGNECRSVHKPLIRPFSLAINAEVLEH